MRIRKLHFGVALLVLSIAAVAIDWVDPHVIQTTFANDKSGDYATAATQFMRDQGAINSTGSMKPGDTVSMLYQDGSVVTFTLNKDFAKCNTRCVWSSYPFKPGEDPKVQQGPKSTEPGARDSLLFNLTPGITLPVMAVYPIATSRTIIPTVTVIQQDAVAVTFSPSDYGGGAAGGGFDSGGGGCHVDCPPVMEK